QVRRIWDNSADTIVVEGDFDVAIGTSSHYLISGYTPPATTDEVTGTVDHSTTDSLGRTVLHFVGTAFTTTNGGLVGALIRIVNGIGRANYRHIAENTGTTITVDDTWVVADGTAIVVVGAPGLQVDPVSPLVEDGDTPGVVIDQSGGTTRLVEGATGGTYGASDTYTVRLTMNPNQ